MPSARDAPALPHASKRGRAGTGMQQAVAPPVAEGQHPPDSNTRDSLVKSYTFFCPGAGFFSGLATAFLPSPAGAETGHRRGHARPRAVMQVLLVAAKVARAEPALLQTSPQRSRPLGLPPKEQTLPSCKSRSGPVRTVGCLALGLLQGRQARLEVIIVLSCKAFRRCVGCCAQPGC